MKEKFLLSSSMITNIIVSGRGNVVCRVGAYENVIINKQIFNIVSRNGMVRGIIIDLPEKNEDPRMPTSPERESYKFFKVG